MKRLLLSFITLASFSAGAQSTGIDAATAHRAAALPQVTGEHYEGGHWLGTFAVYLVTRAGIPPAR